MLVGRPTDYTPELLAKARGYLATCVDDFADIDRKKVKLPSIEGLAVYLDCNRSSVYKWKEEHPEFSDILDKILAEQAERLLNNGLGGVYNANIAKLALGKHGYHDKLDADHKNDGGKFEPGALTPGMLAIAKEFEEKMKGEILE
jgi:hypothetical protein